MAVDHINLNYLLNKSKRKIITYIYIEKTNNNYNLDLNQISYKNEDSSKYFFARKNKSLIIKLAAYFLERIKYNKKI